MMPEFDGMGLIRGMALSMMMPMIGQFAGDGHEKWGRGAVIVQPDGMGYMDLAGLTEILGQDPNGEEPLRMVRTYDPFSEVVVMIVEPAVSPEGIEGSQVQVILARKGAPEPQFTAPSGPALN